MRWRVRAGSGACRAPPLARCTAACGPAPSSSTSRLTGGCVPSAALMALLSHRVYEAGHRGERAALRSERASGHTSPKPTVEMWTDLWINAAPAVVGRYTAGLGIARGGRHRRRSGPPRASFWRRATAPDPPGELCHWPAGSHRGLRRLLRWAERVAYSDRRSRSCACSGVDDRVIQPGMARPGLDRRRWRCTSRRRSWSVQGDDDAPALDRE